MSSSQRNKFEWISLVYLALFLLAVLSPSLVTRGLFGLNEAHIEELAIFSFGLTGMAIFSLYQRLMEKKDQEHEQTKNVYDRAKRELVDSYQYIGSLNRQMEVLKSLANQTSLGLTESRSLTKDLLGSLLASVVSSVNANVAYVRHVELERLRTLHEVSHAIGKKVTLKISNKELKRVQETGAAHSFLRTEDGREILVVPSDHQSKKTKAYLVIEADSTLLSQVDTSLLKVFANHAELIYSNLQEKESGEPLELVKRAERAVLGEIS